MMLELPARDDAEIRALLDAMGEAWARADGDAFASVFTEDADFITMTALELRGRLEIARHHAQIFATVYRGTRTRISGCRIRLIRPDIATLEIAAAVDGLGQERRAHALALAVRGAKGWLLQTFHNMIPFTPPSPNTS
jgi:uncharacterized protein (TIGR02246 family)